MTLPGRSQWLHYKDQFCCKGASFWLQWPCLFVCLVSHDCGKKLLLYQLAMSSQQCTWFETADIAPCWDWCQGWLAVQAPLYSHWNQDITTRHAGFHADMMWQVGDGTLEFVPTPAESRALVQSAYRVPYTLLIQFANDAIDETPEMTRVFRSSNPAGVHLCQSGNGICNLELLHAAHWTPYIMRVLLHCCLGVDAHSSMQALHKNWSLCARPCPTRLAFFYEPAAAIQCSSSMVVLLIEAYVSGYLLSCCFLRP